ncbi:MAG: hypothetical protein WCI27_08685 [Candidatus Omnitrophota bacterium]
MATKESRLRDLYVEGGWKDYFWVAISVGVVVGTDWWFRSVLKSPDIAHSMLVLFVTVLFGQLAKNYGIIRRLNDRISNLEDKKEGL